MAANAATRKYHIVPLGGEFWVHPIGGSPAITDDDLAPTSEFIQALDRTRRRFHPQVRDHDTAWGRLNDSKPTNGTKRTTKLKKALEGGWKIDWYWKLLFLELLKSPSTAEHTLLISQVRSWSLIAAFRQEGPKRLAIRPPIFTRSDRLYSTSQFIVYCSFAEKIAATWRSASARPDYDEDDLVYVLGRHNLTYNVSGPRRVRCSDHGSTACHEIEIAAEIDLDPSRENVRVLNDSMSVTYPHAFARVPVFNRREDERGLPPDYFSGLPLLLASDRYCEALENMSNVWNDARAGAILIVAPPGAGKEVLAKSVHYCRRARVHDGFFQVVGLSPDDPIENKKNLFSWAEPRPSAGSVTAGFIQRAVRGTLFLDEIDKVPSQTRSALLRLLETGEFVDPSQPIVRKLKEQAPVYVFAGSATLEQLLAMPPVDFWTRMTHLSVMRDPLDLDSTEDRRRVLEDYFAFFWLKEVPSLAAEAAGSQTLPPVVSGAVKPIAAFVLDPSVTRSMASFAAGALLRSGLRGQLSVRQVRTIARRSLSEVWTSLLYPRGTIDRFVRAWHEAAPNGDKNGITPNGDWLSDLRLLLHMARTEDVDDGQPACPASPVSGTRLDQVSLRLALQVVDTIRAIINDVSEGVSS